LMGQARVNVVGLDNPGWPGWLTVWKMMQEGRSLRIEEITEEVNPQFWKAVGKEMMEKHKNMLLRGVDGVPIPSGPMSGHAEGIRTRSRMDSNKGYHRRCDLHRAYARFCTSP
jgi:hypothetical protein